MAVIIFRGRLCTNSLVENVKMRSFVQSTRYLVFRLVDKILATHRSGKLHPPLFLVDFPVALQAKLIFGGPRYIYKYQNDSHEEAWSGFHDYICETSRRGERS